MSISEETFRKESLKHSTEEKFIGWALMNPELPDCKRLISDANMKNLTIYGRVIVRKMREVIDSYPDSAHYGRMQDVAFDYAVREMKIPYKYVLTCIDAASCWVPNGPTESEIKELTA